MVKYIELEQTILHSMIRFPKDINAFVSKVPSVCFSDYGKPILDCIVVLNDENALTATSFSARITQTILQSDYCINMLTAEPNPNYLNLVDLFIRVYKLQAQLEMARQLIKATDENRLLDIDSLVSDVEVTEQEFKTLDVWIKEIESKPPQPVIPTGISFLDAIFNGGFESGQLILISGDPEAGKTMLGVQIIENMINQHKVGFFSFEFQVCKYVNLAKDRDLNRNNLIIIDNGYDINEVASRIRKLHKTGVNIFFIDSQLRLTSGFRNIDNVESVESYKFSVLARLCHSLDIIIMLIVQTSKTDPNTPLNSKRGGHEASITLRLERVPVADKFSSNNNKQKQVDMEYRPDVRLLKVQKNKQTGLLTKQEIRYNPATLRFSSLHTIDSNSLSGFNSMNNDFGDDKIELDLL